MHKPSILSSSPVILEGGSESEVKVHINIEPQNLPKYNSRPNAKLIVVA